MRSLLARLAALAALAAVVGGCSTSTSPLPNSGTASGGGGGATNLSAYTQSGYVRIVQGNPNYTAAAPLFVCVDQTTLGGAPQAYGQSVALTLPAGTHIVSLYSPLTGAGAVAATQQSPCSNAPNATSIVAGGPAQTPLGIFTAAVAANTRYSYVVGGTGTTPVILGYTDSVASSFVSGVVLFHDAVTQAAGQPTGTAAGVAPSATLAYTPTGTTAATTLTARLGSQTKGTGGAINLTSAQVIQATPAPSATAVPTTAPPGATGAAGAIPPVAAGTAFTASTNSTPPLTSTVAGAAITSGVYNTYLLDNVGGTVNLVGVGPSAAATFVDPAFSVLGF